LDKALDREERTLLDELLRFSVGIFVGFFQSDMLGRIKIWTDKAQGNDVIEKTNGIPIVEPVY
jgi:hypothetical protein